MRKMIKRIPLVALIALLLVFAGCKGESPTAPPPGGTVPPGGTTPPTGVNLVLTTSNTDPLVDSTVVITATVTQDGQPVPNGTAVEFSTNNGTFTDTSAATTIRTTTNGVATATLTSATAGATRITAVVNNVTRTVDVTFRSRPVTTPPPNTTPTVSGVAPAIGRPSGGEVIRITGTNLRGPVRVLFDTGGPTAIEGFVVSRSDTVIEVITPAVNLGAGQQLTADVIVITEAGSTAEQRVEVEDAFTFRNEVLTPRVSTATPNSGPVTGGTRVTILGDGFQAPVQVLFGSAEARVVEVTFGQIIVEAPAGRDTSPNGSGPVTGPVDITVVNINSATRTTLAGGFRYVAAMQIIAVGPTEGPSSGGTRVTIDGNGFVAPVAVTIGGVAAQPIFVSGTRIIAITPGIDLTGCGDVSGPVSVTNISNGDSATGGNFTFRVLQPVIINVSPNTVAPGGVVVISVANAIPGVNRIKLGDRTVFASQVIGPDGTGTFTATVPTNFTFTTEPCTVGGVTGVRQVPLVLGVTYQNVQSGCTDTVDSALTITPPDTTCQLGPEVTQDVPLPGDCAPGGTVPVADPATGTAPITFRNIGGQPLVITRGAITGTNSTDFTVSPGSHTIAPGASATFTMTFNPSAAGARTASVAFTTNDPDEAAISVCLTGTGQ